MIAIDIAILPPPEIADLAVALSAALPAGEAQGLLLGADPLPHITLTQQFVSVAALDDFIAQVDRVLRDQEPLPVQVTGGGKGSNSVWMSIAPARPLIGLHEQLLRATEAFETATGNASAFFGEDARDRDVRWVRDFRRESSFDRFTPHITLGQASRPPVVESVDFVATTIAACHLGRFCTCRRVIRAWDLRRACRREPEAQSPEP